MMRMSSIEIVRHKGSCYYSILGICKQASNAEIRGAYRKLAIKWHPDRWIKDPNAAHQAKTKFQKIQEAYSILSDKGKRSIYDAGFLDLLEDQDDDTGFWEFLQEMASMIDREKSQEENSLEDLQRLLMNMVDGNETPRFPLQFSTSHQGAPKKRRMT